MMDEVDIFDVAQSCVKREPLKKLLNMQEVFVIQTTEWRKFLVF